MESNKKLYGYNLIKFLMGVIEGANYNIAKNLYILHFSSEIGMNPYNINLFDDDWQSTNFNKMPNTIETDFICNTLLKEPTYNNNNFVTLTKALNLLDLYTNKYESDFITTNFNYLVDSVNKILIRNYSKSLFRDSVDNRIFLVNTYNEYYFAGLKTGVFNYAKNLHDSTLRTFVKNSINDIVDGQLSPQIAKLIESVFLSYNPLYNVDGTETTKEQFNLNSDFSVGNGKINTEGGHGEYILNTTSDRDLETTNSFNNNLKGSTYDINGVVTPGTENKTTISGSVTTKNSESTMNDSDFYNTAQTVQTFGKKENSNDEYSTVEQGYNGSYTGTKTTTGRTDSENTNINILRTKNTNNISDSTKTNTESPYSNVHILTRKGNIGVTKSTELIDAERKTAIYNVAQEVAQLIAHEIFEGVY